jgi:hypothetical protein
VLITLKNITLPRKINFHHTKGKACLADTSL